MAQGTGRVVKRTRSTEEGGETAAVAAAQTAEDDAGGDPDAAGASGDEEESDSWRAHLNDADTWMDVIKRQEEDRKAEQARCGHRPPPPPPLPLPSLVHGLHMGCGASLVREAEERRLAEIRRQEAEAKARKKEETLEEQKRVFGRFARDATSGRDCKESHPCLLEPAGPGDGGCRGSPGGGRSTAP
jgi:hypothetical protein